MYHFKETLYTASHLNTSEVSPNGLKCNRRGRRKHTWSMKDRNSSDPITLKNYKRLHYLHFNITRRPKEKQTDK